MENTSLFINGMSVAQIKDGDFFILKHIDDYGLTLANTDQFRQFLKQYRNVCCNSWDKKLKQQYIHICLQVGIIIE